MAYTTIDKPSDYFNTKLYTGNGGTQSITGLDFQPDWTWIKGRSGSYGVSNHKVYDVVRGATKTLFVNLTNAESTQTNTLTSFNSDGFSLGNGTNVNASSTNFASWNWKAGTSFTNDASGTGIGSIDSTGSVNQDAGFSIVSFDLSGQSGKETIKHGLNSAPKVVITKRRSGGAGDWTSYFGAIGNSYLVLNKTTAGATSSSFMNNTAPTSSVFTVGDPSWWGANPYIAYCFSEKQGYSKFSSYVGNGSSSGTFCYTGMKPAFVMIKKTDSAGNYWHIYDNKRSTSGSNVVDDVLYPNRSDAEYSEARLDFVSNGIKFKSGNTDINASGGTYIYMAFAENPFVTSTGVPATAR